MKDTDANGAAKWLSTIQSHLDEAQDKLEAAQERLDEMIALLSSTTEHYDSPPIEVEKAVPEASPIPTLTPEEYFGNDCFNVGLQLHGAARAIKDNLGVTWNVVADLIAGSPEYQHEDAPNPFGSSQLADMKYAPRWYPEANKHGGRWSYTSQDKARIQYALDAAMYWIQRFGFDPEYDEYEFVEVEESEAA